MARPKKDAVELPEEIGTSYANEATPTVTIKDAPVHYEEWRMEKENGQLVKLKLLRPKVKITEDEAATLNAGAENGQGVIIQYFPKTN